MVMDVGWPTSFVTSMMDQFGEHLDVAKIWDPHLRAPEKEVRKKIEVYNAHNVRVQPGGIFMEIARIQGNEDEVMRKLARIGFSVIEVSSTATSGERDMRREADFVKRAKDLGFTVFGEVGKKFAAQDETYPGAVRSVMCGRIFCGGHDEMVSTSRVYPAGISHCTGAGLAAEQYPARPIRLIVPFPPGGDTDIMGRTLALKLGGAVGVQVVVDNRGSAGRIISRLNGEIRKIVAMPDVKDRMSGEGAEALGSTPEELAKRIKNDIAKWADVVRSSGARAD